MFPLLLKHFTYKTYQCNFFLIVPEEDWFGQPKYSTPSKHFTYVGSVFASILYIFKHSQQVDLDLIGSRQSVRA